MKVLETSKIVTIQNELAEAASKTIIADADGIEIHGTNSYLLWQFLSINSNQPADQYRGSTESKLNHHARPWRLYII